MTDLDVPNACALTQPELGDRLLWIRSEILPHARSCEAFEGGVAWRFGADPELRQKLERLVALERDCCDPNSIEFSLHQDATGESVRLEVRGLDPEHALLGAVPATEHIRPLSRLAKAGGLGALAAFLLFCVLPMGITAVAGAALAAPLAGLESPATLAAGSLAFGAATWWALRRREARRGCSP